MTLLDAAGASLGPATVTPTAAQNVRIDRGGFGVEIRLERPAKVLLGTNSAVVWCSLWKRPRADAGEECRVTV